MGKKFTFTLQKLLNYKEQLFEIERTLLTEMNTVMARLNAELRSLYEERDAKNSELTRILIEGTTPSELVIHKNYLRRLEEAIEEKLKQIELQQAAIDKQMDKVKQAKMEISTMERLKEKKLDEYNYKEAKEQELFIEEFVSHVKAVSEAEAV